MKDFEHDLATKGVCKINALGVDMVDLAMAQTPKIVMGGCLSNGE